MKKPVQVFSFSIQNAAPDTVDVHIDGEVVDASTQAMIEAFFGDTTSVSYKSFRNAINASSAKTFNVIINSPGGHVGDAMAIHDLLVDMQSKGKVVNTIGRGIVASSATLILLAGKNPEMSANSWFMMHTVSGGTYGTVDQVENYAVTMRKFNDSIRDLYSIKSGLRKEDITKLMNAETWLSASEAKEKGLVSIVAEDATFKNLIKKEDWDFTNSDVLNSYNASVKESPITNQFEDMKNFFKDLANEIKNAISGIKPAADNAELVNQIATAVSAPFEALDLEAIVNTAVTESNTTLTARIDALEAANTELVKKNTELEADMVNKLGGKDIVKDEITTAPKPVGSFS